MKYFIVRAAILQELQRLVNEQIEKGFEPIGGVTVAFGERGWVCQAMVAKEEKK